MANAVVRFIQMLENDARKYDLLAKNLEKMREDMDADQARFAAVEIRGRRDHAKMLRQLIKVTKQTHKI